MQIAKWIAPLLSAGLLAGNMLAWDGRAFSAQLIGSSVGQHVAGVPSGGAPWKITSGQVSVSGSGRIEVELKGLLISSGPALNTTGPVTMVMASLVCGDIAAANTKAVVLTSGGNAQIEDAISVPSSCIAPAILIRIAATISGPVTNGPFIAVNALSGAGDNGDDHNRDR